MNKRDSKYFITAEKMDQALFELLEKKDLAYITVKEICAKAGVNRSTFYLHYETMGDLLAESVEWLNERFFDSMNQQARKPLADPMAHSPEELFFITPEYLTPFLDYIREHRRLFRTVLENAGVLQLNRTYEKMLQQVFIPVLQRYQVQEEDWHYMMSFYVRGLMAIVSEWLRGDCRESVEQLTGVMQRCVGSVARKDA